MSCIVVEESKRFILGRSGNKNTSTAQMMLASTIAGAATTITTNPIWLIQTHQATRGIVEVRIRLIRIRVFILSIFKWLSARPGARRPEGHQEETGYAGSCA